MATELTSNGLTISRYIDLVQEMIAAAEGLWGESIDTSQEQLLGHFMRELALSLAEINEALEAAVDVMSAANVSGDRLDHLFALIGLARQAAAYSTVTLTYTVSKATTVPAGHKVKTAANVQFQTTEALVFTGAGSDDVTATCTQYGAYDAAIGEVSIPVTTVDGVTSVTNAAAAIPGRLRATDAQYRAAHALAVATSGENDLASIYEALLAVTGVSSVYTEEDDEAHTVTTAVIGGADDDVAEAINNNLTAGIGTVGSTEVDVYSATTKQTKTIRFSRAANANFYVDITIQRDTALYPDDGDDQIRAALVTATETLRINDTVSYYSLFAPVYTVPGVTVAALYLGWAPSPSGTSDLTTTILQRPNLDSANIGISYT